MGQVSWPRQILPPIGPDTYPKMLLSNLFRWNDKKYVIIYLQVNRDVLFLILLKNLLLNVKYKLESKFWGRSLIQEALAQLKWISQAWATWSVSWTISWDWYNVINILVTEGGNAYDLVTVWIRPIYLLNLSYSQSNIEYSRIVSSRTFMVNDT